MRPTRASIETAAGLREAFLKRHRKDRPRAPEAWDSLVDKRPFLAQDTTLGDAVPRRQWPARFHDCPNLHRLELAHGFRALYTVFFDPARRCHVVSIQWVGDHGEYDRLFGYRTS